MRWTLTALGAEEAEHEEGAASDVPEHSSSLFQKLITPEHVPLGSQGTGTFVLNSFLAIFFLLFEFAWGPVCGRCALLSWAARGSRVGGKSASSRLHMCDQRLLTHSVQAFIATWAAKQLGNGSYSCVSPLLCTWECVKLSVDVCPYTAQSWIPGSAESKAMIPA